MKRKKKEIQLFHKSSEIIIVKHRSKIARFFFYIDRNNFVFHPIITRHGKISAL